MKMAGEQYFELAASVESPRVASDGLFACPCCDSYSFVEAGGYEMCEICGWEDDPVQEAQPNLAGGANKVSLIQARENFRMTDYSDPAELGRRPKLP